MYERTLGNYQELKDRWASLIEESAYYDETTVLIEKFYNDPAAATEDNSICDLCLTLTEALPDEQTMVIAGGKYAVFPYEGTIEGIFRVMQGLFRMWLPKSGYRMRENYGVTIYRGIDWKREYVQLEMCIPIK